MKGQMATFVYRCPNTGKKVQGFLAEQAADEDAYDTITCFACRRVHFVNQLTGKVLGEDDDE